MMSPSTTLSRLCIVGAAALTMSTLIPAIASASVTVVAAGDIAGRSIKTAQRQTAALIGDISPDKLLVLGDAQYEKGTYTEFMQSYDRTWGAYNRIAAPVPGNHEYETSQADGYFRYFSEVLQPYGAAARDWTKGYYSFDVGEWHIVALNSNCSVSGVNCTAQRTWLKADLQADDHQCEIVYFHLKDQKGLALVAADMGAELLLGGHKHTYERWNRKHGTDLRQLVVGTGGKSLGDPSSGADVGVKAYGVAKLTLNSSSYTWQFIDVAGNVRDSGNDDCHG